MRRSRGSRPACPARAAAEGPARLHVDRVFSVHGAGTVVTGTLWSGVIGRGDALTLQPAGRGVRVRGVQVHDRDVEAAVAGQRVAVNLASVRARDVERGDVLAGDGDAAAPSYRVDVALDAAAGARLHEAAPRVQVHHGTRESPARAVALGGALWQLRLEAPLVVADRDRVVVRSIAPPDTLGGAVVVDAAPPRHGGSEEVRAGLERRLRGEPEPERSAERASVSMADPEPAPAPLDPGALALEQRLRAAGHEPPALAALGDDARWLPALREAGRAVRVGRTLHFHPDALDEVRARVVAICERDGAVTIATLRDDLGTSRRYAQALLEHFDGARLTLRRGDEHVLRRAR